MKTIDYLISDLTEASMCVCIGVGTRRRFSLMCADVFECTFSYVRVYVSRIGVHMCLVFVYICVSYVYICVCNHEETLSLMCVLCVHMCVSYVLICV